MNVDADGMWMRMGHRCGCGWDADADGMQMLWMWMSEKKKEKKHTCGCACACSTSAVKDGGGRGWVAEVLTQHVLWDLENFVRVCAATVHY